VEDWSLAGDRLLCWPPAGLRALESSSAVADPNRRWLAPAALRRCRPPLYQAVLDLRPGLSLRWAALLHLALLLQPSLRCSAAKQARGSGGLIAQHPAYAS